MFKHISQIGTKALYNNDPVFASKCRLLCSLAYVPIPTQSFNNTPYQDKLDELRDYFWRTYVCHTDIRGNYKDGRFKIEQWNCHFSVCLDLPRTNNHVEGWHRGFNELVDEDNPNIWKLIIALKMEQGRNKVRLKQMKSGKNPRI